MNPEPLTPYNTVWVGVSLDVGGRKGHVAMVKWGSYHLITEVQLRETVRDVKFLHNGGDRQDTHARAPLPSTLTTGVLHLLLLLDTSRCPTFFVIFLEIGGCRGSARSPDIMRTGAPSHLRCISQASTPQTTAARS